MNEDDASERINGKLFDIHQLENKAFLVGKDNSESISIEFHSSSKSGLIQPQNGFFSNGDMEDSASHSVIFQNSGVSESKLGTLFSAFFVVFANALKQLVYHLRVTFTSSLVILLVHSIINIQNKFL